jgi:hypothetical protein
VPPAKDSSCKLHKLESCEADEERCDVCQIWKSEANEVTEDEDEDEEERGVRQREKKVHISRGLAVVLSLRIISRHS